MSQPEKRPLARAVAVSVVSKVSGFSPAVLLVRGPLLNHRRYGVIVGGGGAPGLRLENH